MNRKEFEQYLNRDQRCPHCGSDGPDLVVHHRRNRGMGGKHSAADRPSSLMLICSKANGLLESSATFAQLGRELGWKLTAGEDSTKVPIHADGKWWILRDDFSKVEVPNYERDE